MSDKKNQSDKIPYRLEEKTKELVEDNAVQDSQYALKTMWLRQIKLLKVLSIFSRVQQDKLEWTNNFIRCCLQELAELQDSFPWKHWREQDKPVNEVMIREEIIDLLHFVLDLAIIWFEDPNDLFMTFMSKNDENFRRQINKMHNLQRQIEMMFGKSNEGDE